MKILNKSGEISLGRGAYREVRRKTVELESTIFEKGSSYSLIRHRDERLEFNKVKFVFRVKRISVVIDRVSFDKRVCVNVKMTKNVKVTIIGLRLCIDRRTRNISDQFAITCAIVTEIQMSNISC